MDKSSLQIILNECFVVEGNCAYLHFNDGNSLLVWFLPKFHQSHIVVEHRYNLDVDEISEFIYIPYVSISYVTVTTVENVNKVSAFYNQGL